MGEHYFNEIQKIWKKLLTEDKTKEDINNSRDILEKLNDELTGSNVPLEEKADFWEGYSWLFSFIECSKSILSSDKIDEVHVEMIDSLLQDHSRLDQLLNEENRTHLINKLKAFKEQLTPKKTAEDYQHEYQDLWAKVVDPNVTEQELDSIIEKAEQLQADVLSSGNLNVEDIKQIKANKANISSIAKTVRLIKTGNISAKDVEFMQFMYDAAVRGEYNKFVGNNAQAQINLASLIFSTFKRTMDEYKQEKENNANKEPVVEKPSIDSNSKKEPEQVSTPGLDNERKVFVELSTIFNELWKEFLKDNLTVDDYTDIMLRIADAQKTCEKHKGELNKTFYYGFISLARAQHFLANVLSSIAEKGLDNIDYDKTNKTFESIVSFINTYPMGMTDEVKAQLTAKIQDLGEKIGRKEKDTKSSQFEIEQVKDKIKGIWDKLLQNYPESRYYEDIMRSIKKAVTDCHNTPTIADEDKKTFDQLFRLQLDFAETNMCFFNGEIAPQLFEMLYSRYKGISNTIESNDVGMDRSQLDEMYRIISTRLRNLDEKMDIYGGGARS